jgi:hypothetical protein
MALALATAPGREVAMNSVSQRALRAIVIFCHGFLLLLDGASFLSWDALEDNVRGSGKIVIVSLLKC